MLNGLTGLFGVMIPLAPFIMVCFIVWSRHQTKLAAMQLQGATVESAEKAAQYASRIGQLEERVRVLERIVTDKGYDVATQIEALRDVQRKEAADNRG